jgi:protein-L-isoaspartate(D-aspartate) O-methyltransferase
LAEHRQIERPMRAPFFELSDVERDYYAKWISAVAIFPCAGNRDEVSERLLADAFAKGGWQSVARLYRGQEMQTISDDRFWIRNANWGLAYN